LGELARDRNLPSSSKRCHRCTRASARISMSYGRGRRRVSRRCYRAR
jgi:hypothetical protein